MASEAVPSENSLQREGHTTHALTKIKNHVKHTAKPATHALLLAAAIKGAALLPRPSNAAIQKEPISISAQNSHEDPAKLLVPNIYKRDQATASSAEATPGVTQKSTSETEIQATPVESVETSNVEQLKNEVFTKHEITLSEDSTKLHEIFQTLQMYPPEQRKTLEAEPWDEARINEIESVLSFFPKTYTASDETHKPIVVIATSLPGSDRAFSWDSGDTFYIVIDKKDFAEGNVEALKGTVAHELFHRATDQDLVPFQNALNSIYDGMTFDEGAKADLQKVTGIDPNSTTPLTDEQKQKLPEQIAFLHAMTDDFGPYMAELYIKGEKAFDEEFSQFFPKQRVDELYKIMQKFALTLITVVPRE